MSYQLAVYETQTIRTENSRTLSHANCRKLRFLNFPRDFFFFFFQGGFCNLWNAEKQR